MRSPPMGYGLTESAVDAARQWGFEPSMQGRVPVEVVEEVTIDFKRSANDEPGDPLPPAHNPGGRDVPKPLESRSSPRRTRRRCQSPPVMRTNQSQERRRASPRSGLPIRAEVAPRAGASADDDFAS
jgi:hypothetical protein